MLGAAQAAVLGARSASASGTVILNLRLDEASGSVAADARGLSNGVYSGSVEYAVDPLLGDGGTSVGFSSTTVRLPHVSGLQLASGSLVLYAQPDSAPISGNRQLFYKDDGPIIGGFAVEQWSDGLKVYYRDGGGTVRTLASGISFPLNAAARIVLTWGATGHHLYVNNSQVANDADTTGTTANTADAWIGSYLGASNFFDGVIDEIRIYNGQLDLAQVQALPAPQSITHTAFYTVPAVASTPGASAIYVAPNGNNTTGNGLIGNPYLTLAKAISVAPSSGGEIVLRKGVYRTEVNLAASGKTNLTIKGYASDIAADPLDPANWPIIDGCFTGVSWESYNVTSTYHEYRTTANFSSGNPPQGMVVAGTSPYQIPRWEPIGGMRVPTRLFRLYPYFQATGARGSTSFRSTAATTTTGQYDHYLGPGVMRETTGRIHIRLDPVDDGMYDQHIDLISDKNPANNQVFLWQQGKNLFSNIANGFTLEGLFIRGYDRIVAPITSGTSNITIKRCVVWGCVWEAANNASWGAINLSSGDHSNWLLQHNVFDVGVVEWLSWQTVKQNLTNGGVPYGQQLVLAGGNSGQAFTNFKFLDNLLTTAWAFFYLNNAAANSDVEVAYNATSNCIDDFFMLPERVGNTHVHHNWVVGAGPGVGTTPIDSPLNFQYYDHHNVYIRNFTLLEDTSYRMGHPMYTTHASASGQVMFCYNNTYVACQPTQYQTGGNYGRPLSGGYSNGNSTPHRTFNNIFVTYVQVPPGGSNPGDRWSYADVAPNDSNRKWFSNGNCFFQLYGPGVSGGTTWAQIYDGARSGSPTSYATLAAWRSSTPYNNTGSTGWNFGGRKHEQDSAEADPVFSNSNAITQDARFGVPPSDYRPTATGCTSGAIDMTSFGWPSATSYQAWRGALDPNGDGSEVGPRPAS
jgi:hypothetical protein